MLTVTQHVRPTRKQLDFYAPKKDAARKVRTKHPDDWTKPKVDTSRVQDMRRDLALGDPRSTMADLLLDDDDLTKAPSSSSSRGLASSLFSSPPGLSTPRESNQFGQLLRTIDGLKEEKRAQAEQHSLEIRRLTQMVESLQLQRQNTGASSS